MSSIRRTIRFSLLVSAAVVAVGCAVRTPPKPDQLTDNTIKPDQAMQRRDWDQSSAMYPNGQVVAGPTEFPFEPKHNQSSYSYYGADSATFLLNVAVMPYSLIVTPPWQKITYPGAVTPPTSTGTPVLASSRAPEPAPAAPAPAPIPASKPTETFAPAPATGTTGLGAATSRRSSSAPAPMTTSAPATRPSYR
jgi:hypothetical protein